LRTTLDEHSRTTKVSKTVIKRNYNDAEFHQNVPAPANLPDWAYASSESSGDEKVTNVSSESSEDVKGKGKGKETKRKVTKESARREPKRRRVTDYEQSVLYDEEEEHRTGESARTGMIRGALKQSEKSAPEVESDNEFDE